MKLFNIYTTLSLLQPATKREPKKVKEPDEKRLKQEAELRQMREDIKLQRVDYRTFNSLEPFSFNESGTQLEALDILEQLQKYLPLYYGLAKKRVETHIIETK